LSEAETEPRSRSFIIGTVATFVVSGILEFGAELIRIVNLALEPVIEIPSIVGNAVFGSFGPVGDVILGFFADINGAIFEIASNAGPAAPIVIAATYVVIGGLTIRLLISVSGEVPVLSTVVDFVGLR